MPSTDFTHDPAARSWVPSADGHSDFPVQNLPLGIFSTPGSRPRGGVAIGDEILDIAGVADLLEGDARAAALLAGQSALNALFEAGPDAMRALRHGLFGLLTDASRAAAVRPALHHAADCTLHLPAKIGDYTDFYTGIHHAVNVGKLFRPDNPLLPNYKYVPVAYHSRPSSIRVSGTPVRRPRGQIKLPDTPAPVFAACRHLDYELELGFYVGVPSELGQCVGVDQAQQHIFGFCLVNDWSARDIQAWEYQPLGPFLAKNFSTTVSPWVITTEALAPYRSAAFRRPEGDPAPLPHLASDSDQAGGGLDITLEAYLLTETMRQQAQAPVRLSRGSFATIYWTVAQMLAHHTSNGCNLEAGDLIASGTVSGPDRDSLGCLLELTQRGKEPLRLPGGESRAFLEDGDEVIFRGFCTANGFARIGFGECRAAVQPAAE